MRESASIWLDCDQPLLHISMQSRPPYSADRIFAPHPYQGDMPKELLTDLLISIQRGATCTAELQHLLLRTPCDGHDRPVGSSAVHSQRQQPAVIQVAPKTSTLCWPRSLASAQAVATLALVARKALAAAVGTARLSARVASKALAAAVGTARLGARVARKALAAAVGTARLSARVARKALIPSHTALVPAVAAAVTIESSGVLCARTDGEASDG